MTASGWGDGPVSCVHAATTVLDDAGDGTRWVAVGKAAGGEVGVWEIGPGTATDVEVDEVFVVLSGRATLSVVGWPDVVVGPGDVVRLRAGAATTWAVTERLRKVYLSW